MVTSYSGKIREVGRYEVTISIFNYGKDEEIIGEVSRDSFPKGKLYAGRVIRYFPRKVPHIEFVRKKPVTEKAIAELRSEVEKMLEGVNLSEI